MAPRGSKQADRKAAKTSAKADDEAAAASDSAGVLAALKQLALGSVLVKVAPVLPKLMKETPQDAEKKEESKENEEPSNEPRAEEKPQSASSVFASLTTRLIVPNTLGLDEEPDEAWALFKGLEVDYGPYKRKKGNAAMERILLNVERNLSQYFNIVLALMCLNALVFRSYFACLPWLVGYQLLSLNLPMDLIRENLPQVPEVDFKFRVAATMAIHALVWFFFLYELLFQTYFLAKLPLIGLIVAHAYVVVPEANLEAARKLIAEKKTAEADEEVKPLAQGVADARSFFAVTKLTIMGSFLVKLAYVLPELTKQLKALKAATPAKADDEKKETHEDEKTETNEDKQKTNFEALLEGISMYNVLGLGLPSSKDAAKESWLTFKGLELDFGPKAKKGSPVKERLMTNFQRNMPQYIHVFFALMCLRSFLFRSFLACLPWLLFYQALSLHLRVIRAKIPQVPAVDPVLMVAITGALHSLVWVFFLYEATFMTHFMEKALLMGLFTAHAYVVSPVLN